MVPSFVRIVALVMLAAVLSPNPASAEVGATQQVRLQKDKPVVGTHNLSYTNYSEKEICAGSYKEGTRWCGYRVARGTLQMKLSTYKLVEDSKFDYYLLDVDVSVRNRSGSSRNGWADFEIATKKRSGLVDMNETGSKYASKSECTTAGLTLSTPWPYVSGAVQLGSVTFCEKDASWERRPQTKRVSIYAANALNRFTHMSTQRWVKVKAGVRPEFRIDMKTANDKCTHYRESICTEYDNRSHQRTGFKISTRP